MEIQVFSNAELGEVRTTVINGEPYFVGKDVAEILGYERPTKAVSDHVDSEDIDGVPIQDSIGRMQNTPIINESGLYSLILSSKMPNAKMFTAWMFADYVEPPKPEVDWDNVPVDTLVRVRNRAEDKWVLRYFKEIGDEHLNGRYFTWPGGTTSKTAEGSCIGWQYCELVEEELMEDEDGNSSI